MEQDCRSQLMFVVLAVGGKHQARWTSKQDAWDWAGLSSRQWVCTCAWGLHEGACEPGECLVCAASDLLPLSAQREEEMWLSRPKFGMSSVHGCCWRQHLVYGSLCEWPCWCPVCACFWDTHSVLLLIESGNRKEVTEATWVSGLGASN